MSAKYAKLFLFFGVLFLLSLASIFHGLGAWQTGSPGFESGLEQPHVDPEDIFTPARDSLNLSMVLALVTAVASGGGFIATTYFAMRDDRRQAALHRLQIQSLRQEIVHKDLEIKRLRQEQRLRNPVFINTNERQARSKNRVS